MFCASLRLLFGALAGLGAFPPLFGFGRHGGLLDGLSPVLQIVVGGVRNLPNPVVAVPSGERYLTEFVGDRSGIRRLDAEAAVDDLKIWVKDRLEFVCVSAAFQFVGRPAVGFAESRLDAGLPARMQ